MKIIDSPSKTTLRKAAAILQGAHDHIELNGFDIDTYGSYAKDYANRTNQQNVPMCYIGNVRFAAGVHPSPDHGVNDDAGAGDGPELVVALQKLDQLAQALIPEMGSTDEWANPETESTYTTLTGRFIEYFGFLIKARAQEMFPYPAEYEGYDRYGEWITHCDVQDEKRIAYQKDYALQLLRQALAEIHNG